MGRRQAHPRPLKADSTDSAVSLSKWEASPGHAGGLRLKEVPCTDHSPSKGTSLGTAPSPELTLPPRVYPLMLKCPHVLKVLPQLWSEFLISTPTRSAPGIPRSYLKGNLFVGRHCFLKQYSLLNSSGLSYNVWKEVGRKPERNLRKLETSWGQRT